MKNIFTLLLLALLLTGCSVFKRTVTDKEVVITPVKTYDAIPSHLLTDCTFPPLPDEDVFMKSDQSERELTLAKHIVELRGALSLCSMQVRTIREWDTDRGGS